MRLMGGDVMGCHVNCLPLWHPKVQAIKNNNNMVVVGAVGRVGLAPSESKAPSPMQAASLCMQNPSNQDTVAGHTWTSNL